MKNNPSVLAVFGMAALLTPALYAAAPVATEEPRKPSRVSRVQAPSETTVHTMQTVLPKMLEFAAESIESEATLLASPNRPPGRPPAEPPGHSNPPNPPGQPPGRPPS